MPRIIHYTIDLCDAGISVRAFLRARGFSRHILASLKPRPDALLRNGSPVFLRSVLSADDVLTIQLPAETPSAVILPAPVPFSIVYEDEDLMVIDKPAGTAIHPALNHPADTLANGIAWHYLQTGQTCGIHCISRLDRDTTGLLVAAKHTLSASILAQALVRRDVRRTYLAIVEGCLPDAATIDLPIGRKDGSIVERCVDREHGQPAVTHYRCLSYDAGRNLSLAELHLDTGRTHQIRVHMAETGHPLLGDTLYNSRYKNTAGTPDALSRGSRNHSEAESQDPDLPGGSHFTENANPTADAGHLRRQALHSWKLEFTHPISGAPMSFTSPLPEDMSLILPGKSG